MSASIIPEARGFGPACFTARFSEPGIAGVAAAIANAVHNAAGIRVGSDPVTPDKHLERLPSMV